MKKMKKIVSLLLAVVILAAPFAIADEPDFASMTDEELHALVDGARNELTKRELTASENTEIVNHDDVVVYLTGNNTIDISNRLQIEVVVINDSDKDVDVFMDTATVNGWNVNPIGLGETSAGKKQRNTFYLDLDNTDITSVEEVEEVELEVYLSDDNTYERIGEMTPVTLHFKG